MVEFKVLNVYEQDGVKRASVLFPDFAGYELELSIVYSNVRELDYVRCLEAMINDDVIQGDIPFAKELSDEIIKYGYYLANRSNSESKSNNWMRWAEKNSAEVFKYINIPDIKFVREKSTIYVSNGDYRGAVEFSYQYGYNLHVVVKIVITVDKETFDSEIKLYEKGNREPLLILTNNDIEFRKYDRYEYQSDYKYEAKDKIEFLLFDGYFDTEFDIYLWHNIENDEYDIGYVTNRMDLDVSDIKNKEINIMSNWKFPDKPTVQASTNTESPNIKITIRSIKNRLLGLIGKENNNNDS